MKFYNLTLIFYSASSVIPSSPWGENTLELTPKLETGWATFDSSFGVSMVTNGNTAIFHKLFPEEDEQNMKDITPPFESLNNPTSPLENLMRNNLF